MKPPNSPIDLDALAANESSATPAPWRYGPEWGFYGPEERPLMEALALGPEADPALIVAMRNALPSMIAELRAARNALPKLLAVVKAAKALMSSYGVRHSAEGVEVRDPAPWNAVDDAIAALEADEQSVKLLNGRP